MSRLTAKQIEKGFWFYDQYKPWEPEATLFPKDYAGNDLLTVACTQLVAVKSYAEQKKLVKEWCDTLPSLDKVKYIWFTTQINQQLFDAVCEMPNLEGFFIKWSSVKDISKLTKLKYLKHLHIGSSKQITDISPLVELSQLVTLDLENISTLKDISPICELTGLEGLGIDGDWNSNQKIDSLAPIKKLQNLKYLTLIGTKVLDKSLKPIGDIKSLERVWTALWFPKSEFEYLYRNLPNLKYGNLIRIMTDEKYCKEMRIK